MSKTYIIRDMLEWHTYLKAGKTLIRVCFTGGVSTPYGISGGRFTTSDPVVQYLIEHTEEYRKKRIYEISDRQNS